ncbi:MAG: hypothetical protein ACI4P4_04000 [Faecousia sp.]
MLTLVMLICLIASCGSKKENIQNDILYAVFSAENIQGYPIEYSGVKKTAVELANELTELTGLDFTITATKAEDGWIVDWTADSSLVAGPGNREQKEDFVFYDYDSMGWFMMDSLWRTLTENLDAENIYYTMNGGRELTLEKMSPAITIPADAPYMGSEFYLAQKPLDVQAPYQGFWKYPNGTILEINGENWTLYSDDGITVLDHGPMHYDEYAAWMMNEDGSSGGRVYFDENHKLIDFGTVLTYCGESLSGAITDNTPKG